MRKTNFFNGGDCIILTYTHIKDELVEKMMPYLKAGADWKGTCAHPSLEMIKPEVLKGKEIHTNIRNPWERCHSQWRFAANHWDLSMRSSHQKVITSIEEKHGIDLKHLYLPEKWEDWSFQDWWEYRHHQKGSLYNVTHPITGYATQREYIKGYDVVCCDVKAFNHLPKVNESRVVRDYRKDYTPEMIQEVADWYKDDIDYWGYDFDTGATRNVVC